ncbi:hypothetical protein [Mesobacillus foraminis]|uniref:hypothetical protein n=1 Tax=Mesobacillus foraminis TaxID=279826 RepID=UPI0013CEEC40|nr:hypothetical protein [Mesobacillus foraminis]
MLGAEDYQPKPYSESSEMMKDHQSNLETIIGKRMKDFGLPGIRTYTNGLMKHLSL